MGQAYKTSEFKDILQQVRTVAVRVDISLHSLLILKT